MVQKEIITIRADAMVKDALEKAAKDDGRTMSQLAERILTEWLKQQKFLK